ncbi:MAG: NAD(+) synthase [Clostridia bacterium]|nr:NAD(+) synthase [Clostridia bacterium]
MRDYAKEIQLRVDWIKQKMAQSGACGFVFGNSGGKDCALVGILCKMASEKTIGVIMPCQSKQNYTSDMEDAKKVANQFGIETRIVDLTEAKVALVNALKDNTNPDYDKPTAIANLNPRMRMATLYTIAQTENCLVVGTGNRSEIALGYFTKWGDGGYDLNPIGDLTVREVYEFLDYLNAPLSIRTKKPSAGLWEGQTDEQELGITYDEVDDYLLYGKATKATKERVDRSIKNSKHKHSLTIYPN